MGLLLFFFSMCDSSSWSFSAGSLRGVEGLLQYEILFILGRLLFEASQDEEPPCNSLINPLRPYEEGGTPKFNM
jgi:hypothetical protein